MENSLIEKMQFYEKTKKQKNTLPESFFFFFLNLSPSDISGPTSFLLDVVKCKQKCYFLII